MLLLFTVGVAELPSILENAVREVYRACLS